MRSPCTTESNSRSDASNLNHAFISKSDSPDYSNLQLDDDKFCDKGDLIYAWSASFGPFIWDGPRVIYHYHIWKLPLFSDADLDKQFLYLFLLQRTREIKDAGHGISMVHMTKEKMEQLAVPLPPLAEQRRIVAKVEALMALLDRLEASRTTREATRDRLTAATLARLTAPDSPHPAPSTTTPSLTATPPAHIPSTTTHARFALDTLPALTTRPDQLRPLRQTILNLAVRGRLVEQDPADEPAAELLSRIALDIEEFVRNAQVRGGKVDSVAREDQPFSSPEGWVWTRLAELCRVVTDGDHQPPPRSEDGVAFLTIGNVTTGKLDFAGCRRVPPEYYEALPQYRTPVPGDLLYTVVGATFGRPVLVESAEPFCVQRHIAILKPSKETYIPYLHRALASPFVYEQAAAATTGTAQPTIALKPLRNFLIPLPPLAEQHRIVAKVDALMALCDRLEAALARADTTRARLLEALLHDALAPAAEPQAATE